jgi:hypothetical protein
MSQPNKKRDRHSDDAIHFEVSAKLSPDDEVKVKVSGKLSEQMRQKLQLLQRWLLPSVGSILVTLLTTTAVKLPLPQQPNIPPGVDVQSK